ncbi:MAG: DUF2244 domain-containing protein [Capsulimonadaceae bacterium]
MGIALFVAGKAILLMAWVATRGVTSELRRVLWVVVPFWMVALSFGIAEFFCILRPMLANEEIEFTPDHIRLTCTFLRQERVQVFPRATVRAFQHVPDPQGFTAGTLSLICSDGEHVLGEHLQDRDRDWLASVGNALLRRLP